MEVESRSDERAPRITVGTEEPEKTLWMGDLALEWDEAYIGDLFREFGPATVFRPYDARADRPALYAFVVFPTAEDAEAAYDALNGASIPESRRRFRLNPRARGRPPPSKRPRSYSPEGRRPPTRRRDPSPGDRRARSPSFDRREPSAAGDYRDRDRPPAGSGGGRRGRDSRSRSPLDAPRRPAASRSPDHRERRARPRSRSGGRRPRDDERGGGARRPAARYVRLTLAPGGRVGEVPAGVRCGKVLADYCARFVDGDGGDGGGGGDDDDRAWRAALRRPGNRVVAALVDGVLVDARAEVAPHHASLAPVLAHSPLGRRVLERSLLFCAALSTSLEQPGARLVARASTADGCIVELLRGAATPLPCGSDAADRLAASLRQLVDLDVAFETRELSRADADAALGPDGAAAKWLRARPDASVRLHYAEVRLSGDDGDVHAFYAPARTGAPLAASSGSLAGVGFAVEVARGGRALRIALARRRPRVPLDAGAASRGSPDDDDGAATLAARGSWAAADGGGAAAAEGGGGGAPPARAPAYAAATTGSPALAAALEASDDARVAGGLDCCGTVNALARGGAALGDRLEIGECARDAALARLADGIVADGVRAVLVGALPGGGGAYAGRRLSGALRGRGAAVAVVDIADHAASDGAVDAARCAAAVAAALRDGEVAVVVGAAALGAPLAAALAAARAAPARRVLARPGLRLALDDLRLADDAAARAVAFIAALARHETRPATGADALRALEAAEARDGRWVRENRVDAVLDVASPADLSVLKTYAAPALKAVHPRAPEYARAASLLAALHDLDAIPADRLPARAFARALLDGEDETAGAP